ncbi:MAG: hypothetical protein AABY22_05135, partial [Nanoarchaeota archaeon]
MDKPFTIIGLNGEIKPYLSFQKTKRGTNAIGMDTGNYKQWIHFWIGRHETRKVKNLQKKIVKQDVFIQESV